LKFRTATKDDAEAIAELCRALDEEDYILRALDQFLETGVVFLAVEDSKAIGVIRCDKLIDGDTWSRAARVHPDYQRQGVGTVLISLCEKQAVRWGSQRLRFWVDHDNVPATSLAAKLGYKKVAVFTNMFKEIADEEGGSELQPVSQIEETWDAIRRSPLLVSAGFYIPYGLDIIKLEKRVYSRLVSDGTVFSLGGREYCSLGFDQWKPWREGVLSIGLMTGGAADLIQECLKMAVDRGYREVRSFLPRKDEIIAAALGLRFEYGGWGIQAILYEKILPRSHQKEY